MSSRSSRKRAEGQTGRRLRRREGWSRRELLKVVSAAGIGSAMFGRALSALAEGKAKARVTPEMVRQAEWISGIRLSDDQRKLLAGSLDAQQSAFETLRGIPLDNAVPPALRFDPTPGVRSEPGESSLAPPGYEEPDEFGSRDDLAFESLEELSARLRYRQITATELTELYLDRLRALDPRLSCVVTLTEDLALRQAERADREIAAGRWRGPLHGIPWGAKDLMAVPGHPTTWGAAPFRDQRRPEKATVASRLEASGAVLVAKLSVGELAWGDEWFGGITKNPWRLDQGSSGSSAGSAAAVAAGLVGFALGTETWGSIVSPCTRCGATGLRPTFGRVSRHGVMALAWSMDKVGPIARSAADCAIVFHAIHGEDPLDPAAVGRPFSWPLQRDVRTLRVGVAQSLFEADYEKWADEDDEKPGLREWQGNDGKALAVFRDLGLNLLPFRFPDDPPVAPLAAILTAEAAAAFDDLTRSGQDSRLRRQMEQAWPNVFRQGQLIPAVEYIRANRVRTILMRRMEETMRDVDVVVTPTYGGDALLLTNLTGHPCVVVPAGFRESDGTPTSLTLIGRLHGEAELLAVAQAFQEATDFHLRHPPVGFLEGTAPDDNSRV